MPGYAYERVTLREVPYNPEDEKAVNFGSGGSDMMFELVFDDKYTFGVVYISKDRYTVNALKCPIYIDWIEFFSCYTSKGLLHPTMDAIHAKFGDFYLESTGKAKEKYEHVGCKPVACNDVTEHTIFKYSTKPKGDMWAWI